MGRTVQGIPEDARIGTKAWPANPFPDGHTVTVKHGAHSERLVGPLSDELLESIGELVDGTPAAIPTFAAARGVLARKLARLTLVVEWLEEHGWIDDDGDVRAAADLEVRLLHSVEKSLDTLGLTPVSAAKLGVDLARTRSLSDELQEARDTRERAEARHAS